jgi:hypothetical protein
MPLVPDLRYTGNAVVGEVRQELLPEERRKARPSVLDTLAAASRVATMPGALVERLSNRDPDMPDAPEGWDALDNIQGYEEYAQDFIDVTTPSELAGRKARIDSLRADRQTLERAGLGGPVAEIGMSMLDPSFLAAVAVPELAVAKGVRMNRAIRSALQGATTGGAYEIGMQELQDTRTANDALFSVGAGALLGGVLGTLGRTVPNAERKVVTDALNGELARSETGAAAVARPTTMAAESLAAGGQQLSKGVSKVPLMATDLDRVMQADSIVAKQVLQDLADIPGILGKNVDGEATPASVESFVHRWDASLADFSDLLKSQWIDYTKRVPRGQRVSREQFYAAVSSASRRSDASDIPEVAKAAQFLRSRVFDPLKDDAQKLGLLKDPVEVAQAKADERAVGDYFKAEEAQLFADYQARTRAAIKEGVGTEGDAADLGAASGRTQTEFTRALTVEQGIRDQTLGDSLGRVEAAQANFDRIASEARRNLEDTLTAAREEAAIHADKFEADAAVRADQQALGMDILKGVREESVARTKATLEQAQRRMEARSREARSTLKRDKARIEILKAKLELEAARRQAAKEIADARRQFMADAKKVRAQYAGSEVPPAGDRMTAKAVREFRAALKTAKHELDSARNAEAKLSRRERQRFRKASGKLKASAEKETEALKVARLKDFRKRAEAVASRTADDADPAVKALVKLIQDRTEGKLLGRVTRPTVDASKIRQVAGAETYFRRMYDREAIRRNRSSWDSVLISHFMKGGVERHEAIAAAEDITRKILGGDIGEANWSKAVTVAEAGPLKERMLDIRDELIEPFLVNDPMKVANAYVRDLAPQVEITKRFGDREMKETLGKISEEYEILRERARKAGDSKEVTRLEKQEKDAKEALVRVRDRLLGRAGRLAPSAGEGARRAVQASRGWRNLVASARLGGTALTGGTMDTFRIIAQYGFLPTVTKLAKLASSKEFRDASKAQARRVGSAVEAALSRRVQVAYDGAITEGWTQKLADGVYKWTGLNHITDFNRTLSATLLEDKVLKVAAQVAEGGRPKKFDLTRLASLGLDEDALKRIHQQVGQHGGEAGDVRVSGSADWTDKKLADLYDNAILKESKIVVQQPGAADRVWWMDTETGKLLGQLKTFSLSSPMRMLVAPVQAVGQGEYGRAARLVGFMMVGGYLTHALRQVVAGRTPQTDPAKAAAEAITESGLLGIAPDILSPVGRRLGFGESVRYADRSAVSAYGGPALGMLTDAYDMAFNRTEGGISAKDMHAMRRLLPYNNAWFLRRQINALEGELAEAMQLEGYDTADFTARMLRTEPFQPSKTGPPKVALAQ